MKIMLDCSQEKILDYSERYGVEFWQLRTPLTRYKVGKIPYGLDNGCFSRFERATWERMLDECESIRMPEWIAMPDVVGSALRTLELFEAFELRTNGLPRALVLQDGIGQQRIPWGKISAVFIGGTDSFKISPDAFTAARTAKMLGKWVHVGRVNNVERLRQWHFADSIDGSGLSRFDHMLERVLEFLAEEHPEQANMF